MSITIGEATVGMWQFELPSRAGNWLAHVARLPEGRGFRIDYRFRYYLDTDMSRKTQDQFSWFGGDITPRTDESLIGTVRSLWTVAAEACGAAERWELLRGTRTVEEFVDAMLQQPGMHVSQEQVN